MTKELDAALNRNDARALTERIRGALQVTWGLVLEAYQGRAWEPLGYESWDEYTREEFGSDRMRLPRVERRDAAAALREAGMSTRAIAAGLGVDAKTVRNDLQGGEISPPARVHGVDGKTYGQDGAAVVRRLALSASRARARLEAAEAEERAAAEAYTVALAAEWPRLGLEGRRRLQASGIRGAVGVGDSGWIGNEEVTVLGAVRAGCVRVRGAAGTRTVEAADVL